MARWSPYNLVLPDDSNTGALLFNLRTGVLSRIDSERIRELTEPETLPQEFSDFLLRNGYLVSDDCDELALIGERHEKAKASRDVVTATVELTEACNLRCRYCYQEHQPGHMSPEVVQRVIRYLCHQVATTDHLHINWFGGEPLLALRQLREIARGVRDVADAGSCGITQFITTNGYLLTPRIAAELVDLGVESAQITIDGEAATHDVLRPTLAGGPTFARVLAGCVNAVDAGMSLLLRVNLSRLNEDGVARMLDSALAAGLTPRTTTVHVTRMVDHGQETCDDETSRAAFDVPGFARSWARVLSVVAERGFAIPHLDPISFNCPFDLPSTFMIGHDGTLRHCSSSDATVAVISDEGIAEHHTDLYGRIKDRTPLDDPECRACKYLPMCMGGCSYLRTIGQDRCAPERYALPDLIQLTAHLSERK